MHELISDLLGEGGDGTRSGLIRLVGSARRLHVSSTAGDVSMTAQGTILEDVSDRQATDVSVTSYVTKLDDVPTSEVGGGKNLDDVSSTQLSGAREGASTVADQDRSELFEEVQQLKLMLVESNVGNKALEREKTDLVEENERIKNLQSVEGTSCQSQNSSTAEAGNLSAFLSCIIKNTTRHNLAFYSTHFRETLNKCCASTLCQSGEEMSGCRPKKSTV